MTTTEKRIFEARGVLAGAYRAGREDAVTLTHFYDVTAGIWGTAKTLCGRIAEDRLSDEAEPEHASCKTCAARFARLAAKDLAAFRADHGDR